MISSPATEAPTRDGGVVSGVSLVTVVLDITGAGSPARLRMGAVSSPDGTA